MYRLTNRSARSPRVVVVAMLLLGVAGPSARAGAPVTWNSPVSGLWTDTGLWNPMIVPDNFQGSQVPPPPYDAFIDVTGAPYTVTMDQFAGVDNIWVNSPDATFALVPGSALNGAAGGGIHIGASGGVVHFNGGAAFVPQITVANPLTGSVVFDTGVLILNGSDLTVGSGGLFGDNLTLGPSKYLGVDDNGTPGQTLTRTLTIQSGASATLDGGTLQVNRLVRDGGGTFTFNSGSLQVTNGDLEIGPNGQITGDFTNVWERQLDVSGTVTVANGQALTLDAGVLRAGLIDLTPGGTFTWNGGLLRYGSTVVLQAGVPIFGGVTTLGFDRSLDVHNGQDLIVGDTVATSLTVDGSYNNVEGDVYVGRSAGSDGSVLRIGTTDTYNGGSVYAQGSAYIGGDALSNGGSAELVVDAYGYFTADGLVHIRSNSSLLLDNYGTLYAGQLLKEGTANTRLGHIALTDTPEVVVDSTVPNGTNAPFGSTLTLEGYGVSGDMLTLSVNNFMSIGHHGGTGSVTLIDNARLEVGNVLTVGAGGSFSATDSEVRVGDFNPTFALPGNVQFNNVHLAFTGPQGLTLDPSYYQLGDTVAIDGGMFRRLEVTNGPLTVGASGFGQLTVDEASEGLEAASLVIGGGLSNQTIGSVSVFNNGGFYYSGVYVYGAADVGIYDNDNTNLLDIGPLAHVTVGGNLTIGSTASTNLVTTGRVVLHDTSQLYVEGMLTVNPFGQFEAHDSALSVGSFNIQPGATVSINYVNLAVNDGDLAIGAGQLLGDNIVVDPAAGVHPGATTVLTGLYVGLDRTLTVGVSPGFLTVLNAGQVQAAGTLQINSSAEVHVQSQSTLIAGRIVVAPGGTFDWEDGFLRLTNTGLVLDASDGSLPIGHDILINSNAPEPSHRGLSVAGELIVGLNDSASLDYQHGFDSFGRLVLGRSSGASASASFGTGPGSFVSIGISGNVVLGGDDAASGGAASAELAVHEGASLYLEGVLRIWDNHLVTLDGGLIRAKDVVKDGGGGAFLPANGNFAFTLGTLILTDADLEVDAGGLLGQTATVATGMSLTVSRPLNLATTTVRPGAAFNIIGGFVNTDRLDLDGSGALNFTAGTLVIDGEHIVVDHAAPDFLGGSYTVGANMNLRLQNSDFLLIVGDTDTGQTATMTFNGGANYFSGGQGTFYGGAVVGSNTGVSGVLSVGDTGGAGRIFAFGPLVVGDFGQGQLQVTSTSYVSFSTLLVARQPGSTGQVSVDSASTLAGGDTFVGGDGTTDGGMASVTVGVGGSFLINSAALNVHTNGVVQLNGGTLNVRTLGNLGGHISFNSGQFIINNASVRVATGELLGSTVTLPVNSRIHTSFDFVIGAGAMVINRGVLEAQHVIVEPGGVLKGDGGLWPNYYFDGGGFMVTNAGELEPGASPGILTIHPNYYATTFEQTGTGALIIELGGPTVGSGYDRLVVNGNVILAGTLDLRTINGYQPYYTDTFDVLTYTGTLTGTFASVLLNGQLFSGVSYDLVNKKIVIQGVPEPASLLLLAAATGLFVPRRPRRSAASS